MITMMVIMLGVLAIIAAAGFGVFSVFQSTERLSQVSRNAARLEQAGIAVRSAMRSASGDGFLNVPAPEFVDGRPVLPAWLGADASTPWGVRYGYCAYGALPPAGGDGADQGFQSGSVDVDLGGYGVKPYVVRSSEPVGGRLVRAFVISPVAGQEAVPPCSDVTIADGVYRVAGGTVQPVYESYSLATLLGSAFGQSSQMATVYVSNAASVEGNKTGANAANPMTLAAAVQLWKTGFYRDIAFDFAATGVPYDLTGAIATFDTPAFSSGRRIAFLSRASQPSQRPVLRTSGPGGMDGSFVFGADVVVRGVGFPQGTVALVNGARGEFSDTSLGGLELDGASASVQSSTVTGGVAAHRSTLSVSGSSLAFVAARASSTIALDTSVTGQVVARDSRVDLGRGVQVDPGAGNAGVQAFGSTVNVSAGLSCAEPPVAIARSGAAAAFDLYGSNLFFGGRDVAVVEPAQGNLFAVDASSSVKVAPRACSGAAVMPSRLIGASLQACASGVGGGCAVVGPIPEDVGPRPTEQVSTSACSAAPGSGGASCQVTATCASGRVLSGGCDFAVTAGGPPVLQRFRQASPTTFVCQYGAAEGSAANISAVAQCAP